ncbi:hypothetical protein N799_12320 [Lysobacter arseniciresistens ZS79]|uniref:Uncharacterized protein n=1 Tax=Lysobacter arseniciresistens ZS79 TaxID=913325 RepID=A0A0A0F2F2_9GAMM|nr:hypothetical protein N799_12320 [Lysobacter arseniciresistens ZS79]
MARGDPQGCAAGLSGTHRARFIHNTRTSEDDWHGFKGGDQRETGPDDAAAQGGERPPGRHS